MQGTTRRAAISRVIVAIMLGTLAAALGERTAHAQSGTEDYQISSE